MADPSTGWRLAAPAKLNLWLAVTGRRPDGYHELDSALVLLDLEDELAWSAAGRDLVVSGLPGLPDGPTNLAWRGWEAGLGGVTPGGGLTLDKRVPAAAGLGGGSSDAAAAWRLGRWIGSSDTDLPGPRTLASLAAIGADVPFFAAQLPAARVRGVGEEVEPMPLPDAREVVLVHPPFALATAAVFAELHREEWTDRGDGPGARAGRNDLEGAARRLRPELVDLARRVAAFGGEPHLTGSGPTLFIVSDDPERADAVAARVTEAGLAATRTRVRSSAASIEPVEPSPR